MARVSGKSARKKRARPKPVSKRQVRKSVQRSQVKFRKTTLEVKAPVSQRGRTGYMEQAAPDQPQLPQQLLMQSTALKKFKYWINEKRLRIWFVEGGVYDYYNVPESIVMSLSNAQSKGRFFYYNIRTSFEFERIR